MRGDGRRSRAPWPLLIVLLLFLSWTGPTAQAEKGERRILVPAAVLTGKIIATRRRLRSGMSRIRGNHRCLPSRLAIRYVVFLCLIPQSRLTSHPTFVPRRIPIRWPKVS